MEIRLFLGQIEEGWCALILMGNGLFTNRQHRQLKCCQFQEGIYAIAVKAKESIAVVLDGTTSMMTAGQSWLKDISQSICQELV